MSDAIRTKMQSAGLPEAAIRTFEYYYGLLKSGEQGMLTREMIEPVPLADTPDPAAYDEKRAGKALAKTVIIKLNGGLGTGMGMTRAKSLLTVKDKLTFLDIIVRQVRHLRREFSAPIPLLFMNSFSTRKDTLAFLGKYDDLDTGLGIDFLQHKVPKIRQDDLAPVTWDADPGLEWCPPGHGDIYTALQTSGLLDKLLEQGMEYAFVSNADNLGAVYDPVILDHFAANNVPFMMEVTTRTEADKKGGHLARYADGRLVLRETAQCPPDEKAEFEDVSTYKYFNTNNLWINLPSLKALLSGSDGIIKLPMIVNGKTVDPRRSESPEVYQLETAMGAAISAFAGSRALAVDRSRFTPVKKCSDLLAVSSDAYIMTEDFRIVPHPERPGKPVVVDLDEKYYKLIDQLRERFPHGAPSLKECDLLKVRGDMICGEGVVIKREGEITNPSPHQKQLPAKTVVDGSLML